MGVVDYGNLLALEPLPGEPVKALHGMLAAGPSPTDDLLAERGRERSQRKDRHS